MKHRTILTVFVLVVAAVVTSCTATTQSGALLGGGIGAGTGAIIGHQTGDAGEGALIGAAIGALSGALIGNEIDRSREPVHHYEYHEYRREYHCSVEPCDRSYYEGPYDKRGRRWVPEHEEIHIHTAPDGSKYERRVIVPGHYE